MNQEPNDAADRESRIDEVIAEYLEKAETGSAPDRSRFLSTYPELADELAEFLTMIRCQGLIRRAQIVTSAACGSTTGTAVCATGWVNAHRSVTAVVALGTYDGRRKAAIRARRSAECVDARGRRGCDPVSAVMTALLIGSASRSSSRRRTNRTPAHREHYLLRVTLPPKASKRSRLRLYG